MRSYRLTASAGWLLACLSACVLESADAHDEGVIASEGNGVVEGQRALATGTLRLNDVYTVRATPSFDGANMYATASASSVLRRLAPEAAVKIVIAAPSNGRYRVDHAGALGWVAGEALTLRQSYDATLSLTRIDALAGARAAMGFSYWWSNARWPASGGATTWPTSNTGACSGDCGGSPACVHRATGGTEYGADCSGFVSTIWGFPDFDSTTNPTNNGFATVAYNKDTSNWSTVATADALPADALVQHNELTKHVFLLSTRRNAAGNATAYECRGCAFGCMMYSRNIADGSGWHAIRRAGW